MNPIWLSAIVRSALRHQRTEVRTGLAPDNRCSAKQSARTPLESPLGFLRGIVKWVRGIRGRGRLGSRTQKRMKCPRCGAATLNEPIHEGSVFKVCEHCRGVWLDRMDSDRLIQDAVGKSDDSAMSRVRQWEETFKSSLGR